MKLKRDILEHPFLGQALYPQHHLAPLHVHLWEQVIEGTTDHHMNQFIVGYAAHVVGANVVSIAQDRYPVG